MGIKNICKQSYTVGLPFKFRLFSLNCDSQTLIFFSLGNMRLNSFFIENMTREQYTHNARPTISGQNVSRQTLNPKASLDALKKRLAQTEHYKNKVSHEIAHWPYHAMDRVGHKLWRYKFNYAIKAGLFYMAFREVQNCIPFQ
jgi:hypothetical protein